LIFHGLNITVTVSVVIQIDVEELMRMAMDYCQDGISVGGKMLQSIRFADDQSVCGSRHKKGTSKNYEPTVCYC